MRTNIKQMKRRQRRQRKLRMLKEKLNQAKDLETRKILLEKIVKVSIFPPEEYLEELNRLGSSK